MAKKPIEVETLTHDATRKNIPTAEFESIMRDQDKTPIRLAIASVTKGCSSIASRSNSSVGIARAMPALQRLS